MLNLASRGKDVKLVAGPVLGVLSILCLLVAGCAARSRGGQAHGTRSGLTPQLSSIAQSVSEPLVIGETLLVDSKVLSERRRVNVFTPTVYGEAINGPLPVLYMLDGGMGEDFLHVAGLVQVLVSNGNMRPFMLVGIENTQRRRDLTGPTTVAEDLAIAPAGGVGGSDAFRRFLKEELMPMVRARYRTASESAIVGESLAGLFVLETMMQDPDMFNTFIAIDPSLWWNGGNLVSQARQKVTIQPPSNTPAVFVATSDEQEMERLGSELVIILEKQTAPGRICRHVRFPTESHATIYHPAAIVAFRTMFAPIKTAE